MPTNSEVRAYANRNSISRSEAKKHLNTSSSIKVFSEDDALRKAERMVKKLNLKSIHLAGYFYHGMMDDGVSISINKTNMSAGLFHSLVNGIEVAGVTQAIAVHNGIFSRDEIWKQLKALIHNHNIKQFGSPRRPTANISPFSYKMDEELIELYLCIGSDIVALTMLGEIENAEYDGVLYHSLTGKNVIKQRTECWISI
jgi:hypothetical protein